MLEGASRVCRRARTTMCVAWWVEGEGRRTGPVGRRLARERRRNKLYPRACLCVVPGGSRLPREGRWRCATCAPATTVRRLAGHIQQRVGAAQADAC